MDWVRVAEITLAILLAEVVNMAVRAQWRRRPAARQASAGQ
jgi:hypothetical protein